MWGCCFIFRVLFNAHTEGINLKNEFICFRGIIRWNYFKYRLLRKIQLQFKVLHLYQAKLTSGEVGGFQKIKGYKRKEKGYKEGSKNIRRNPNGTIIIIIIAFKLHSQ